MLALPSDALFRARAPAAAAHALLLVYGPAGGGTNLLGQLTQSMSSGSRTASLPSPVQPVQQPSPTRQVTSLALEMGIAGADGSCEAESQLADPAALVLGAQPHSMDPSWGQLQRQVRQVPLALCTLLPLAMCLRTC